MFWGFKVVYIVKLINSINVISFLLLNVNNGFEQIIEIILLYSKFILVKMFMGKREY